LICDGTQPTRAEGQRSAEEGSGRLIIASGKVPRELAELPEGGLFFSKPYRHRDITGAMRALLAA